MIFSKFRRLYGFIKMGGSLFQRFHKRLIFQDGICSKGFFKNIRDFTCGNTELNKGEGFHFRVCKLTMRVVIKTRETLCPIKKKGDLFSIWLYCSKAIGMDILS